MRNLAISFAVLASLAGSAHGIGVEDLKIDATVSTQPNRDKFKIRARITGADLTALDESPLLLRFGDVVAEVPANGFRRRGKRAFTWRGSPVGVKKVSFNVKKSTMKLIGGSVDLGDLDGPVVLAMAIPGGALCGEVTLQTKRAGKAKTRMTAQGPLGPCDPSGSAVVTPTVPEVLITSPAAKPGFATIAALVTLAGEATDDVAVTSIDWSNDRGGAGSIPPAAAWTIADVPLQVGDNRITVTVMDADGNTGTDVIDVTYNDNGLVFEGVPVADPGTLPLGPRRLVSIGQAIATNPDLDPDSIEIVQVGDGGEMTSIGPMVDDGEFANGDKIQGDGRYSARVPIEGAAPGFHRFRVSARTLSAPGLEALSPIVEVPVTAPLTRDALEDAITLADMAGAMLDQLIADGASEAEILDNLTNLAHIRSVQAIGLAASGRGAWWVTEDGLLGGALAQPAATPPAATGRRSVPLRTVAAGVAPPEPLQVGTRRTIVLSPSEADTGATEIADMLAAVDCPLFEVSHHAGTDAGAERFQALEEYGIVVVGSTADTLFGGIDAAYQQEWQWPSVGSQVVLLTGTTLSHTTLARWQQDLRLGRMAIMRGGVAALLPSFLTQHSNGLPGSLVLLATDNATANSTLTSAFFELGAITVLGFDGYVDTTFVKDRSIELFTALLNGGTVGDVFVPGQSDGSTPPATYTLAGTDAASINTDIIVNGSFEFTSGLVASVTGFDVTGDAHVVNNLGTWLPTVGERMALVSTGLGLTTTVGLFEQTVCIPPMPPGATTLTLSYDWNFFSEEFPEFCGSQFQDSFEVEFDETVLQSSAIDDLCGIVVPDPIEFDQGDVQTTQWISQSVDVTAFAGTTTKLAFGARDVGDSIFDSVILVDDVRLTYE